MNVEHLDVGYNLIQSVSEFKVRVAMLNIKILKYCYF